MEDGKAERWHEVGPSLDATAEGTRAPTNSRGEPSPNPTESGNVSSGQTSALNFTPSRAEVLNTMFVTDLTLWYRVTAIHSL